jgi:hypothetical protein
MEQDDAVQQRLASNRHPPPTSHFPLPTTRCAQVPKLSLQWPELVNGLHPRCGTGMAVGKLICSSVKRRCASRCAGSPTPVDKQAGFEGKVELVVYSVFHLRYPRCTLRSCLYPVA